MDSLLTGIAERRLTDVLMSRITEEPVVVLNGPRTVGKARCSPISPTPNGAR